MFKVAILGCENSHANSFLNQLKNGRHPDMTVIGVYSDEEESCKKLNAEFGVHIMESYDELVGKVDGIMITARHGDNHYKYAKPYLASGIPMFIDKPITCDGAEAVEFMREAKKYGVRLCGGSSCKYLPGVTQMAKEIAEGMYGTVRGGNVAAPLSIDPAYGGFYFYSQHLVQMMTTIFGNDVEEVAAISCDKEVAFVAKYKDYPITGSYTSEGWYYHATVFGGKGLKADKFAFTPYPFECELDDMYALLTGAPMKETYDEFIRPVFILNALDASMKSGKSEKVVATPV
ncbi:MAG: Gfo/Idh/MocA family oxidoreductase [Ruminococcaceae bacterium]|nr:Gfo/Idh/MocA family oxidoreductase [Oscillospiraceae bacterium]